MTLLNASNLKKAYGTRTLFDKVSFSADAHDKIGLIGANGTGKTTLLRIFTGDLKPDSGELFLHKQARVGYMQQHAALQTAHTLWDELMTVYRPVMEMERRLESVAGRLTNGVGDAAQLAAEQHALNEQYEALGGFTYKSVARASLLGLGFSEADFNLPFSALSGGQQTRVILCKLLLGQSNLLLLDEPTNHLDIQATEWLEEFLRGFSGAFLVISHDRYFLDRVTNSTFALEHGTLTAYRGNYSAYMGQKEEREKTAARRYENTKREIERIEGIIAQQKQWNRERNIRTAESKQKMIDRLSEGLERPEGAEERLRFAFRVHTVGGSEVLHCKNLKMCFSEKPLFHDVNMDLYRGERAFLLGANGCGKTTLFKILTGQLQPVQGTVQTGSGVQIGYFDQQQQTLSPQKQAIDEVWDAYPQLTQTEVRSAMAAFLFKNDEVFKIVSELSGGERARLALLKLMLSGANLLVLDEPTNHLDIRSREALEDALDGYDGTLLVVSHDRYFINKLANKIYSMENGGVTLYSGDYSYFTAHRKAAAVQGEQSKPTSAVKLSYQEAKARDAALRKLKNRLQRIEEEISALEAHIAQQEGELLKPENATDFQKSMELTEEIAQAQSKLETLYEQWEEAAAQS